MTDISRLTFLKWVLSFSFHLSYTHGVPHCNFHSGMFFAFEDDYCYDYYVMTISVTMAHQCFQKHISRSSLVLRCGPVFIFLTIIAVVFCFNYLSMVLILIFPRDLWCYNQPAVWSSSECLNWFFLPTDYSLACSLCYQGISVIFIRLWLQWFFSWICSIQIELLFPGRFSSEFSTSFDLNSIVIGNYFWTF